METDAKDFEPHGENKLALWVRCDPTDFRYLFPSIYGNQESVWHVLPDDYTDWPSKESLEDKARIAVMQHQADPDKVAQIQGRLKSAEYWLGLASFCRELAPDFGLHPAIRHKDVKSLFDIINHYSLVKEFYEPRAPGPEWLHGPEVLLRWKIPEDDSLEIVEYELPIFIRNNAGEMVLVNEHLGFKSSFGSRRTEPNNVWFAVPRLWWVKREHMEFCEKLNQTLRERVPDVTRKWLTIDEVMVRWSIKFHKLQVLCLDEEIAAYRIGLEEIVPAGRSVIEGYGNFPHSREPLEGCMFKRSDIHTLELADAKRRTGRLLPLSDKQLRVLIAHDLLTEAKIKNGGIPLRTGQAVSLLQDVDLLDRDVGEKRYRQFLSHKVNPIFDDVVNRRSGRDSKKL